MNGGRAFAYRFWADTSAVCPPIDTISIFFRAARTKLLTYPPLLGIIKEVDAPLTGIPCTKDRGSARTPTSRPC